MQTLKMVMVTGALVAVAVLSVAGIVFSDDTQTTPSTDGSTMTNSSTAAPAPAQ